MPLTEPGVQVSRFRLFSVRPALSKRIKVVKDSRLWKRVPAEKVFKFFPGKAFLLASAVNPFEGHPLRSVMEGLHFLHVTANAVVKPRKSKVSTLFPPDWYFFHAFLPNSRVRDFFSETFRPNFSNRSRRSFPKASASSCRS